MAARGRSVFSWGANSYGQLGNGTSDDVLSPRRLDNLAIPCRVIVGGGGHTLMISEDNKLYSCGWNSKGQLGISTGTNVNSNVTHPCAVTALGAAYSLITKVAAGWDFTFVLTGEGKIYSWGSNAFGQLATTEAGKQSCDAHHIRVQLSDGKDAKFSDVAAGLRHGAAVTECGRLYVWGSGKKGQLAMCDQGKPLATSINPREVAVLDSSSSDSIVQVVCGAYHTACLTKCGHVYVWGENKHGQAGVEPEGSTIITSPSVISAEHFSKKPVVSLHSGWTHLLARTADGDLYSWGRNDYGQLGRATPDKLYDAKPGLIQAIKSPKMICCGSEHNMCLSSTGAFYCWGWNEHGICGTGNEENVILPHEVQCFKGSDIISIGCGMGHSFVNTAEK